MGSSRAAGHAGTDRRGSACPVISSGMLPGAARPGCTPAGSPPPPPRRRLPCILHGPDRPWDGSKGRALILARLLIFLRCPDSTWARTRSRLPPNGPAFSVTGRSTGTPRIHASRNSNRAGPNSPGKPAPRKDPSTYAPRVALRHAAPTRYIARWRPDGSAAPASGHMQVTARNRAFCFKPAFAASAPACGAKSRKGQIMISWRIQARQ